MSGPVPFSHFSKIHAKSSQKAKINQNPTRLAKSSQNQAKRRKSSKTIPFLSKSNLNPIKIPKSIKIMNFCKIQQKSIQKAKKHRPTSNQTKGVPFRSLNLELNISSKVQSRPGAFRQCLVPPRSLNLGPVLSGNARSRPERFGKVSSRPE